MDAALYRNGFSAATAHYSIAVASNLYYLDIILLSSQNSTKQAEKPYAAGFTQYL